MSIDEALARLIEKNQAARARTFSINREFGRAFSFGSESDWLAVYEKYFGGHATDEAEGAAATGRDPDGTGGIESPAHSLGDGPGAETCPD